jgi:hypothetical protein
MSNDFHMRTAPALVKALLAAFLAALALAALTHQSGPASASAPQTAAVHAH